MPHVDQYLDRTEDNVLLEPIIDDILGERSREGLSNFDEGLDELSAEALGFLKPTMLLPVHQRDPSEFQLTIFDAFTQFLVWRRRRTVPWACGT